MRQISQSVEPERILHAHCFVKRVGDKTNTSSLTSNKRIRILPRESHVIWYEPINTCMLQISSQSVKKILIFVGNALMKFMNFTALSSTDFNLLGIRFEARVYLWIL